MTLARPPRVTLLGGFAVRVGDHAGTPLPDLPRAVQRLVARLGLTGRADRNAVAGELWPDVPEDRAHGSLRSALWRLRRVAPGMVQASGGTLSLADGVRVDVRELETWAVRVLDPRVRGADLALPGPALRGRLLPGWDDEWVLLERERLRQLRMHALEALADALVAAGRCAEALAAARAAVEEEPLRESAHRAVVRAHLAAGDPAAARRACDSFRDLLADTLGVAPTPAMTRLLAPVPGARRDPARVPAVCLAAPPAPAPHDG